MTDHRLFWLQLAWFLGPAPVAVVALVVACRAIGWMYRRPRAGWLVICVAGLQLLWVAQPALVWSGLVVSGVWQLFRGMPVNPGLALSIPILIGLILSAASWWLGLLAAFGGDESEGLLKSELLDRAAGEPT
jgi:hypothetical protein